MEKEGHVRAMVDYWFSTDPELIRVEWFNTDDDVVVRLLQVTDMTISTGEVQLFGFGPSHDFPYAMHLGQVTLGEWLGVKDGEIPLPRGWDFARRRTFEAPPKKRLETGPFKPDPDDWTGIFIRGDNAMGYAIALRMLLDGSDGPLTRGQVEDLIGLLESCREGAGADVADEVDGHDA